MTKKEIKEVVSQALTEINESFNLSLDLDSNLVGEIDSIILVNLIVLIEGKLNELGYQITIADDKAFSASKSPFLSIETLINYLYGNYFDNRDT